MPVPRATPGSSPAPATDAVARILAVVRAIPRGQVAGYGEVAARAGLPGRARLAARVLSENSDPALPWHRVLRADGRIAFAPGSREWREQARLLRAEGIDVREGRVARRKGTLDAALWGPDAGPADTTGIMRGTDKDRRCSPTSPPSPRRC